jgi:hypothetical protein
MKKLLLILAVIVLPLSGCGTKGASPESYLREDVDFNFVQRIAVLPFHNNSDDNYAPVRTRDITITHVLTMGLFDVVERDLVDSALREEVVTTETDIDPLSLKRLGSRLKVQAFLLGTVDMAGEVRIGNTSAHEIALTLRLIEAESGMVLWQASGHRSGESLSKRLLGISGDDAYKITQSLVRTLLGTLDF